MSTNTGSQALALLGALFDEGSVVSIDALADAGNSGVATAWGTVDGNPVCAFAQDDGFLGGAFGKTAAAKLEKLYGIAAKTGAPVVGIYHCLGARLGDGSEILTALGGFMSRVSALSGVVPQISVVTGTCGGSMAMIASCADLLIVSEKAELFLNPPELLRENNPDSKTEFGTPALAAKNGTAALVTPDAEQAVAAARRILSYLPSNNLDAAPVFDFAEPLSAADYIDADSFVELYADYAPAAVVGFATIGGQSVGVADVKGDDKGLTGLCAAKKLARFVRLCDAYSLPVITLIDTEGFCLCGTAEEKGGLSAAASLAHAYAESTCAKIAVVRGKAIGPLFIALAGKSAAADLTFAFENAVISPVGIKAAALLAKKDALEACPDEAARARVFADYAADEASAKAAASAGLIDAVIAPEDLRGTLLSALAILEGKRATRLPKKHSLSAF